MTSLLLSLLYPPAMENEKDHVKLCFLLKSWLPQTQFSIIIRITIIIDFI